MIMPDPSMSLNSFSNEISVFTDDLSYTEVSVVIKGTIYVPTDYSLMHENMLTNILTFTVTFRHPCETTTVDPFSIQEIIASVSGGPVSSIFEEVADFKSKINGDQSGLTFCGSRTYSAIGTPSIATVDEVAR